MASISVDIDGKSISLTEQQAISLLSGKDFWRTRDIPSLGLGSLKFTDGPNGARGENWTEGKAAVCFPCSTALGASFDRKLLKNVGKAIAKECIAKNANAILAPTVNIHRYLLNGRNFESYSEDPHLSGHLATHYIEGVQSEGVGACPKHFLANEAENGRRWSDSVIEERALREIYLEPFRILIKESSPLFLMTSYNSCNGEFCSESKTLLGTVRDEWKYKGLIISDWFGTYSTSAAFNAGLDVEMPGPTKFYSEEKIKAATAQGLISSDKLTSTVQRVIDTLRLSKRIGLKDPVEARGESPEQSSEPDEAMRILLRRAAADSMVLLRNENNILPFISGSKTSEIAIIGQPAADPSIFGGGSASLLVSSISTPLEALRQDFPLAKFSKGVPVQRMVDLASAVGAPESAIKLKWYNSSAPDEAQLFRDEVIPKSEYMMMEHIHAGLKDLQQFCTNLEMTIVPTATGLHRLSLTGPGDSVAYLDGVPIAETKRKNVVTEDYIFNRANLELCYDLPEQLEAGKEYCLNVISRSSPHNPIHINREFYVQGCRIGLAKIPDEDMDIKEAQESAAASKASVVFVGTSPQWESEGFDRVSYNLPGRQGDLVKAVAQVSAGPTIVIINAGSPVDMTAWINDVDAVIQVWFPGQEYGNALADIITGRVSPSGRLPTTIPRSIEGTSAGDLKAITDTPHDVEKKLHYAEGLRVGYRAYSSGRVPANGRSWYDPLFAFGHGLSFSQFSYSKHAIEVVVNSAEDILVKAHVTVQNSGQKEASEVVQLYIQPLDPKTDRPELELRSFAKTARLAPGEAERLELVLEKEAFSFWDVERKSWKVEAGVFRVVYAGSHGVGDWIETNGEKLEVLVKKDFHWSS